jgi:hypothetical protein
MGELLTMLIETLCALTCVGLPTYQTLLLTPIAVWRGVTPGQPVSRSTSNNQSGKMERAAIAPWFSHRCCMVEPSQGLTSG